MISFDEHILIFMELKLDKSLKKFNTIEELRKEFINKFPKTQLENMMLDDYVVGKGTETFCYWMETKLRALGSIKGGSTADKKFGVYYNKKEGIYKTLIKWHKKLNPEQAFNNIKTAIRDLLINAEAGNITNISENPLSPMFKNKILTVYYPDKYLNIFSEQHIDYYLGKLGVKYNITKDVEEKRKLLLEIKTEHPILSSLNNFIFTELLYDWCHPKINEIRILPMSSTIEFPRMSYNEIQEKYFLGDLKYKKNGYYNFRVSGLNAPVGTLILFQINNAVIACAKLKDIIKYEKPLEDIYNGAYLFDVDTIRVFEPIESFELSNIDSNFNIFTQVKQKLDPSKYEEILALIDIKSDISTLPEELSSREAGKYIEGSKKSIIINAYERNPKARMSCIKKHGTSCLVCGFNFSEIYGDQFTGKIHVHHIKPLHEINNEYVVDPEKDLVPVCPNCHLIIHSKSDGGTYSIEEVKTLLLKKKIEE